MVRDIGLQGQFFSEPEPIKDLEDMLGKTIMKATNYKLGAIKFIMLTFTDSTYCIILANDPRIEVGLMEDTEKIIPHQAGRD